MSQNGIRGLRVEGTGGLVAEQDARLSGQSPCDGHALLLAAGKLRRVRTGAFFEPDELKHLGRLFARFCSGDAGKLHGKTNVVQSIALHEQVELLEYHAHGTAHDIELALRQGTHIAAFEIHLSLGRALKHIDAAYKRALSRPTAADDAEYLTFFYGKVNIPQGVDTPVLGIKPFAKAPDLNDGPVLRGFAPLFRRAHERLLAKSSSLSFYTCRGLTSRSFIVFGSGGT